MMKFLKFSAWSLLVMLLASLVVAGLLTGLAHEGLAHSGSWSVVVDGDTVADARQLLHEGDDVFAVFAGLALSCFVLLILLPLMLLLGVGLPMLVVALGLGAVVLVLLSVSAVIALPLLLPILLVVWLARRRPTVPA